MTDNEKTVEKAPEAPKAEPKPKAEKAPKISADLKGIDLSAARVTRSQVLDGGTTVLHVEIPAKK